MGTDLGYEFSDGNFVSDVLLRPVCSSCFQINFPQRKKQRREQADFCGERLIYFSYKRYTVDLIFIVYLFYLLEFVDAKLSFYKLSNKLSCIF